MNQPDSPTAQELFRVGAEIRDMFVHYSPVPELSPGQFHMLWVLGHVGGCGPCMQREDAAVPTENGVKITDLAQKMHNAVPTISQRADELEALGYIERCRGKKDRRAVYLVPTEKGRALMTRARALYADFGQRMVARLGDEELRSFLKTLNDLKAAIAAEQAEFTAAAAQATKKEQ